MLFYIQGSNIISKDISNQLICSDFSPTLHSNNIENLFIHSEIYKETAISIASCINLSKIKDSDTIILNTEFFRQPGFVNSIFDQAPSSPIIKSDLEFILNSKELKEGEYTFIDILKDETNIYKFVIENNQYHISSKQRRENSAEKKIILDKLNSFNDNLFITLFSYNNIILINEYLKINQIKKEDFADLNFSTSSLEINQYINVDLSTFFDSIASFIKSIIGNCDCNEKNMIIKSPLTSYSAVNEILKQSSNALIINELEILDFSTLPKSLITNSRIDNYELKYYPELEKVSMPFSIWLLSETDNLNFEILKIKKENNISIEIPLTDLKDRLSKSFFTLGVRTLVKFHVELKYDCCCNLQLKIKTTDKDEYYYLINDL
jgi:hypothetical protein